jgi:hypothetical protein
MSIESNCQKSQRLIPMAKFNDYFEHPKVSQLRWHNFKNTNNFNRCVVRLGGRLFIDTVKFWDWVEVNYEG